jgi:hypothetical protein
MSRNIAGHLFKSFCPLKFFFSSRSMMVLSHEEDIIKISISKINNENLQNLKLEFKQINN